MSKFDPYEALHVDRDASDGDIRQAAKRAAKETHPDAGGDADKFAATRRALAILIDKKKRAHFDRTGEASEPAPDTKGAKAMEIIATEIGAATNDYLMSNFNPQKDPRNGNLIERIEVSIAKRISQECSLLADGKKHAKFLRDFRSRFSKKTTSRNAGEAFDFITRRISDEIEEVERRAADLSEQIDAARLALELIRTYEFKFDPPPVRQNVVPRPVYYEIDVNTGMPRFFNP